jgi:hypothetical protein
MKSIVWAFAHWYVFDNGRAYIPKSKTWWEKSWKGAEIMVHFCNATKISLRMFFQGENFGEMD